MKLELGSGARPTPGYIATDALRQDPRVEEIRAEHIDLPDNSVEEVLALGVIEHLTFEQARATFANVYRMLEPGGEFLFDVPDLAIWCAYLLASSGQLAGGSSVPFSREHVLCTLYGWQRWPGDEHKSGWTVDILEKDLIDFAVIHIDRTADEFLARGHDRRRFHRPEDAHLYVRAVK